MQVLPCSRLVFIRFSFILVILVIDGRAESKLLQDEYYANRDERLTGFEEENVDLSLTCPPFSEQVPLIELALVEKLDSVNNWTYIKVNWSDVASPQPLRTSYWITCKNQKTFIQDCSPSYEYRRAYWSPEQTNCSQAKCLPLGTQLNFTEIESVQKGARYVPPGSAELSMPSTIGATYFIFCKNGKHFLQSCVVKLFDDYAEWSPETSCSELTICPPLKSVLPLDSVQSIEDSKGVYISSDSEQLAILQPVGTTFFIGCKSGNYFEQRCQATYTQDVAYWYPTDNNCSKAVMCPPLKEQESFIVGVQAIEKYDIDLSQWSNVLLLSTDLAIWQPRGTHYWVGCSNGAIFTLSCGRDYDAGIGTSWYPAGTTCESAALVVPPPPKPSDSLTCPALDLEGVEHMQKYATSQWISVTPLMELAIKQTVGTYFWIACSGGKSFTQMCEQGEIGDPYWSSTEVCLTSDDDPLPDTQTCPPLKDEPTFLKGLFSAERYGYSGHRWTDVHLYSEELNSTLTVGSYYWFGCHKGASYTVQCRPSLEKTNENAVWSPNNVDCATASEKVPAPVINRWSAYVTCENVIPRLRSAVGVVSIERYDPISNMWTHVQKVLTEINPIGTKYWVGCSNGASFVQHCNRLQNGTIYWLSEEQDCSTAAAEVDLEIVAKPTAKPVNQIYEMIKQLCMKELLTIYSEFAVETLPSDLAVNSLIFCSDTIMANFSGTIIYTDHDLLPIEKYVRVVVELMRKEGVLVGLPSIEVTSSRPRAMTTASLMPFAKQYKIISRLKVKRIKIPKSKIGGERLEATSPEDLFEITPENWHFDLSSIIYQTVKQVFTDELVKIYEKAGLPVLADDIDMTALSPLLGDIHAYFTATVQSNEQFGKSFVEKKVGGAIAQFVKDGAFEDSFGSDGVFFEVFEVSEISTDSTTSENREISDRTPDPNGSGKFKITSAFVALSMFPLITAVI